MDHQNLLNSLINNSKLKNHTLELLETYGHEGCVMFKILNEDTKRSMVLSPETLRSYLEKDLESLVDKIS